MVHVAPARRRPALLLVVQRVRGGHQVLDRVREAEVALVEVQLFDVVEEEPADGRTDADVVRERPDDGQDRRLHLWI